MNESQLNAIKANWTIACDRTHPDNESAIVQAIHVDMPALFAYATIEVHNQTLLKMEVLTRIRDLSEHYRKIEDDSNGLDSTTNDSSVGEKLHSAEDC